jgi:3-keto-5-aminohexanoate cleavage enzyme
VEPLIITVAPTGSSTTREKSPDVPITPEEIADEICLSWQAGAAIARVHARGADGRACMDIERFRRAVELVRQRCDVILNLTTSGPVNDGLIRPMSGLEEDECIRPLVELHPEMASFDAGSTNLANRVFVNHPAFLERLAGAMLQAHVKPEIEVFEPGFISNAIGLAEKGLLQPPLHFQFVLGVHGAAPATPKTLQHMVESIPAGSTWPVIGLGRAQLSMAAMAIVLGGHVRVGMEDNVYLRKGLLAKSNAEFVSQVAELANVLQRPLATVDQARCILGLSPLAEAPLTITGRHDVDDSPRGAR